MGNSGRRPRASAPRAPERRFPREGLRLLPTWAKSRGGTVLRRRTPLGLNARRRTRAGGPRAQGRQAASWHEWAAIRAQVLTRAGWHCQACGVRRRLDVHHVVKRSQGGSDFDLDGLVALCRWCHDQTDAPYERGAARGDPVGRRSVYVRGRRAGGTWHSPGRGCSICPRGQKLSPSTITVARPRWGRCAHLGKPRPLLSRETRQQNVLLAVDIPGDRDP